METCYLLIADAYSGGLYVETKASKQAPVDEINDYVKRHTRKIPNKSARLDGGSELGRSRAVRDALSFAGYRVDVSGPDSSSFQHDG